MSAPTLPTRDAESLVRSAVLQLLERREYQARLLNERAHRIVGAIPEGEATDEDLDYVTAAYMAWARAWEALASARTALDEGQA